MSLANYAGAQIALGVNIDHVATLREARRTRYPSVIHAALTAEQAGADSITAHLREDRRHIQPRDIDLLKELLQTRLNLEMAVTEEMLDVACHVQPYATCLVPERREELTTEGGLDVAGNLPRIREACARLASAGVLVSLFIDARPEQIEAAFEAGAPAVELHTGHYADAANDDERDRMLEQLSEMARFAATGGLRVHAGHGLNYHNVIPVCRIGVIRELNIGHAIVAQAVLVGFGAAVRQMKGLIQAAGVE
ncbi:MAG: pyridoxine 5'-phosphate synthase [Methylotetracoccus sp.]|nr:pyridoxine 5'-phosphate synthase [Methylotetracoccus sp.]